MAAVEELAMSVEVPTKPEFEALVARVDDQESRIAALEAGTPPQPEPPDPGDYTDVVGPITATTGERLYRLRVTSPNGHGIVAADDVVIEDCLIGPVHGHGVLIDGTRRVKVVNSIIATGRSRAGTDQSHGVYMKNGARDILIQGCAFAQNESHMVAQNCYAITIRGNYGQNPLGPNPRGQHIQCYPVNKDGPESDGVIIDRNFFEITPELEHSNPRDNVGVEDSINIGGGSKYAKVTDNYIVGGSCGSGCGIILEGRSDYGQALRNICIRTSQCGVSITGSAYCLAAENKVLDPNLTQLGWTEGNTGIVAWYQSSTSPPEYTHDNRVDRNIVSNRWTNGQYSDIWIKSGCGSKDGNTTGDSARALLTPEAEKLPRPPIPPLPWTP